jgi:RNA polymerase sigma-70 factor (ECF subfamily)
VANLVSDEKHSSRLITRAAAGDSDALGALFQEHGEAVFRVAYRMTGSVEDAEDVLQDVFVGLPEALRAYRERGSFGPWLRQVTARTALMRLRGGRRRREESLDIAPSEKGAGLSSSHDLEHGVVIRLALERALAELPDVARTVFMLKVVEGYSHAEIAVLLDIRRGTSEVRLFRAIRQLQSLLRDFA